MLPPRITLTDHLGHVALFCLVLPGDLDDVPGNLLDHVTQLQILQPTVRDGTGAVDQTEEVAGDQAGAVAVAAVVDGCNHAFLQAVCRQGAPQADGQSFFGHPATAQALDGFGGELLAGLMQGEYSLDDAAGFLHARLVAVRCQTGSGSGGEFHALDPDPRQDVSEQPRRQIAARVPVGSASGFGGIVEGAREEGAGRHAHHAAAALAVVVGQFAETATGTQGRQAGIARSPA